jgi:XTP/dITP diphosphohydrolase
VTKLVRRNPHVFGDEQVADVDEIMANWERIKQEEKARGSALDGIATSQPALALAEKILSKARRANLPVDLPPAPAEVRDADDLGAALFDLVARALDLDLDAEAALRRAALARADAIRAAETPQ